MKIVKGIFIILVHLALGVLISGLISGFLPGSVIGMMLMYLSLRTGLVKKESVQEVAVFLTGNMTIFFLPAMVGIMDLWGLIKLNFFGWLMVLVISTICVMVSSGLIQELVGRISQRKEGRR